MPVTSALFECGNKGESGGGVLDGSGIYGTQGVGAGLKGWCRAEGFAGLWSRPPASPEAPAAKTRLRPGWATRFLAETAGLPPLPLVLAAAASAAPAAAAPAAAAVAPAAPAAPAGLAPASAVVASPDAPRLQPSAPAAPAAPAPWRAKRRIGDLEGGWLEGSSWVPGRCRPVSIELPRATEMP